MLLKLVLEPGRGVLGGSQLGYPTAVPAVLLNPADRSTQVGKEDIPVCACLTDSLQ